MVIPMTNLGRLGAWAARVPANSQSVKKVVNRRMIKNWNGVKKTGCFAAIGGTNKAPNSYETAC
jgi:hypothetical protein